MKKIILILMLIASTAYATPYLLGTKKIDSDTVRTIWADPTSSTTGVINSTTPTRAWGTGQVCDTGTITLASITGSNVMNVALQTTYGFDSIETVFYNAIGTSSAPYHQVTPVNTDTHRFDFNSRGFNQWRLVCLAGCDVTNAISSAEGVCWQAR